MTDIQELKVYIQKKFAEHVGLSEQEVFGEDLTLAMLMTRSTRMTNSVDLMEAFARTANALRKDHGVRVRLPQLALDTPVSRVLEVFVQEVHAQTQAQQGRVA